jgi:competence protein ComEA
MSRGSRFALWLVALLICIPLYLKGRVGTVKSDGAAFLHPQPGKVTVRLAGDFPRPGVYRFPKGTTAPAAIKMTVPDAALPAVSGDVTRGALASGDIVTLFLHRPQRGHFTLARMPAKEMVLLGIPLKVDELQVDDWDSLPGIGPVLAARIMADRQENGAFQSVEGLLRVPGVGPAKLAALRKYF